MAVLEYPMQAVAPTVARILGVRSPASAEVGPIEAVCDALAGAPRVAVLGVDALGLGIWRHWKDRTPILNELAREGLLTLRSVMPSVTPVNFGCMITGAAVETHGAETKTHDFACETLFDVLRDEGRVSAGLGRQGWSGNELLGRFADQSAAGRAVTDAEVEEVFDRFLGESPPDFVIAQFGMTDEMFHAHGPFQSGAGDAVAAADAWVGRRLAALRERDYAVLVLADHGQHEVLGEDGAVHGTHGTDSDEDCVVPLIWEAASRASGRGGTG